MAQHTGPNIGLTWGWADGDPGWGGPTNDSLKLIDTVLMLGVISILATPPSSPTEGDRYIVGASATGIWAGKDNQIAAYVDAGWIYFTPKMGWTTRAATGGRLDWNGSAWALVATVYSAMVASGPGHAGGLVPDPGSVAGITKFLREDGTWAVPAGGGGGSSTLAGLTDVDLTGLTDAQVLAYVTSATKWEPRPLSIGALTTTAYTNNTWDPTRKAANVTLSNGNKSASINTSSTGGNVLAQATATGKVYFEVKLTAGSGSSGQLLAGITDGTVASTVTPAAGANGIGVNPIDGQVYINSANFDSITGAPGIGGVLGIAYDPTAGKVWFRFGAGTWNAGGSGGVTGDPAAGTGGYSWASTSTPTGFLGCNFLATNPAADIVTGAPYANAAPAGFGPLATASSVSTPSIKLSDVLIASLADGDVLRYEVSSGFWKNKPLTAYAVFGPSGAGHTVGLVPDPGVTAGTTKYLREDSTWVVPPNTTYAAFGPSGSGHTAGLVPDPGATAGNTKYLREDGSWSVPPTGGGGGSTTLAALTDVNVTPGAPIDGFTLTYDNATSKWVAKSIPATLPYDFGGYYPGVPVGGQRMIRNPMVRAIKLTAGLAGSVSTSDVAATASTVLVIKKITAAGVSSNIGTITFAVGGKTGTFAFAADVSFAAGDMLVVDNAATADATLGNISTVFLGARI